MKWVLIAFAVVAFVSAEDVSSVKSESVSQSTQEQSAATVKSNDQSAGIQGFGGFSGQGILNSGFSDVGFNGLNGFNGFNGFNGGGSFESLKSGGGGVASTSSEVESNSQEAASGSAGKSAQISVVKSEISGQIPSVTSGGFVDPALFNNGFGGANFNGFSTFGGTGLGSAKSVEAGVTASSASEGSVSALAGKTGETSIATGNTEIVGQAAPQIAAPQITAPQIAAPQIANGQIRSNIILPTGAVPYANNGFADGGFFSAAFNTPAFANFRVLGNPAVSISKTAADALIASAGNGGASISAPVAEIKSTESNVVTKGEVTNTGVVATPATKSLNTVFTINPTSFSGGLVDTSLLNTGIPYSSFGSYNGFTNPIFSSGAYPSATFPAVRAFISTPTISTGIPAVSNVAPAVSGIASVVASEAPVVTTAAPEVKAVTTAAPVSVSSDAVTVSTPEVTVPTPAGKATVDTSIVKSGLPGLTQFSAPLLAHNTFSGFNPTFSTGFGGSPFVNPSFSYPFYNPIYSPTGSPIFGQFGSTVGTPIGAPIGSPIGAPIGSPIGHPIGNPINTPIGGITSPISSPILNPALPPQSGPAIDPALNPALNPPQTVMVSADAISVSAPDVASSVPTPTGLPVIQAQTIKPDVDEKVIEIASSVAKSSASKIVETADATVSVKTATSKPAVEIAPSVETAPKAAILSTLTGPTLNTILPIQFGSFGTPSVTISAPALSAASPLVRSFYGSSLLPSPSITDFSGSYTTGLGLNGDYTNGLGSYGTFGNGLDTLSTSSVFKKKRSS